VGLIGRDPRQARRLRPPGTWASRRRSASRGDQSSRSWKASGRMRPYRSASHGSKAQDWRSDSFHRGAAAGKPCIDFEPRAGVSYAQQRGPQKSCRRRPRKSRTDL